MRHPDLVVVHGAASGVDLAAADWARLRAVPAQAHPANWDRCGPDCPPGHRRVNGLGQSYCPTAGLRRNLAMVATGLHGAIAVCQRCRRDDCASRAPHLTHGTGHCVGACLHAGVPLWAIGPAYRLADALDPTHVYV